MRIAQINATSGSGSTGKICFEISCMLSENEIENRVYYASGTTDHAQSIRYMTGTEIKFAAFCSRVFGNWGFNSKRATKKMIKKIDQFKPDIVHLHNIHGHNCHLELLLNYLKEASIKVVWTFHDCWAFTGYCMHYDMVGCQKWKDNCRKCPQRREHSWFFDKSQKLYERKKKLLSDLDLTVITPSEWLASQVKKSFLKDKDVRVINNGIDLSVFKPTEGNFRDKNGLDGKIIILGVAFGWDNRKGLDVFIELSERLSECYQIVLVGTDDKVDKKLPDNIISIHRTQDQKELAEIYSAADIFVNPTREENYPTVNMEALACGTPVITFDTGGSAEIIDKTCGVAVRKNDTETLVSEIIRVCEEKPCSKEQCIKKAREFDKNERFKEYLELYEGVNAART